MKANAKINLTLRIINQREDGYHNLQMINAKINLSDKIKIKINKKKIDEIIYINSSQKHFDNDIILKVLKAFKAKFGILDNFKITIIKNIPIGAGLGGASMDAACIIKALIKKYKIEINQNSLVSFLTPFGADIPYGLYDTPCFVSGIGDEITPCQRSLSFDKLIMIYPYVYISTKEMFKRVTSFDEKLSNSELFDEVLNNNFYNNFFECIKYDEKLKHIINETKKYGQIFMSGSGSTLFLKPFENIKKAYKEIKQALQECKVQIIKIRKE